MSIISNNSPYWWQWDDVMGVTPTMTHTIIFIHHRLHSSNGNNNAAFGDLYEATQWSWRPGNLKHTTTAIYGNSAESSLFQFVDNNTTKYEYIYIFGRLNLNGPCRHLQHTTTEKYTIRQIWISSVVKLHVYDDDDGDSDGSGDDGDVF